MTEGFIIAIDGPVASGKGTIASLLAKHLNGFHLYTGAIYRCVALACKEKKIDLYDEMSVALVLPKITIDFSDGKILLNGREVTERIKETDIALASSIVATNPTVREDAVRRQQAIGRREIEKGKIVVSEGRDTATKVFPNAALKIFLTADPHTRAKRRKEQEDIQDDIETVLKDIEERDTRDLERESDPLVSDPKKFGYMVVDNSDQTEQQTVELIMDELKNRTLI